MKTARIAASTGFALFSMFFGSGNLVFPILVGQESQGHLLLAGMGIILTGVIIPFLGVLGMMLYQGNLQEFFSCFGKRGTFLFSLLALALMGPFGVLARCLTVAHGALVLVVPNASLELTSLTLCAAVYILSVNRNKIVTILGTYLTPLLLASIAIITYFAVSNTAIPVAADAGEWKALKNGFFQGYQTMDLLASFFFSGFVINHLYHHFPEGADKGPLLSVFFKSALIGAAILSTVYGALVLLGWMYAPLLVNVPPQEMLGTIAMNSLEVMAGPCVAFVIFACLTTAIVLTSLFADFLRHEVSGDRLGNHTSLLITLAIGFTVSTFDFAGIASFLGPMLETIYPALIVLTVVNICLKLWGAQATHWPFTLTLVAKLCWI
ncbi:MAG: branched-chain amino acid transport system II carrier protein [Chlamydiales bacterium]|nr:branched-chain amino acid transport system II carrier protein [Chlamydiales bacterium]